MALRYIRNMENKNNMIRTKRTNNIVEAEYTKSNAHSVTVEYNSYSDRESHRLAAEAALTKRNAHFVENYGYEPRPATLVCVGSDETYRYWVTIEDVEGRILEAKVDAADRRWAAVPFEARDSGAFV